MEVGKSSDSGELVQNLAHGVQNAIKMEDRYSHRVLKQKTKQEPSE